MLIFVCFLTEPFWYKKRAAYFYEQPLSFIFRSSIESLDRQNLFLYCCYVKSLPR